ncbi:hypothetical protein AVEN_229750-1, partial [Araneus ventricosus]
GRAGVPRLAVPDRGGAGGVVSDGQAVAADAPDLRTASATLISDEAEIAEVDLTPLPSEAEETLQVDAVRCD